MVCAQPGTKPGGGGLASSAVTTYDALPEGDIAAWRVEDPEITGPLPRLAGVAPDWDWEWDWDPPGAAPGGTAPASSPPPTAWYAKTGMLLALIGAAGVALVVATVLLLAPDDSRQAPEKLRPVQRTTPASTTVIVPPAPAPSAAAEPAEPSEPPGALGASGTAGAETETPVSAEQLVPPSAVGSADSGQEAVDQGEPRIKATRAPTSLDPGS